MTYGRDIVSPAVPFVAGIAVGAFIPTGFVFMGYASAAFLAAISVTLLFLLSGRKDKILIIILFVMTGLFCAFSSRTAGEMEYGSPGPLARAAAATAERLKGCIDGIPFRDRFANGLVKALLTGDRSGLDKTVTEAFRNSGASHILALSGLHLGIIYMILTWILSPLGNSRRAKWIKYLLTVGLSGYYAIATGASPSIMRAFLFILVGETGKMAGRRTDPLRTWFSALTIQLAVKPLIIKSVGFQLSYLAMAGIFLMFPRLKEWYPDDPDEGRILKKFDLPRRIWEAAALAISCQTFTAPLAWYYFGTFPKYFLITNLLAMPLATAVMVLSVAVTVLSAAGTCPGFMVMLDEKAVSALIRVLTVISSL